MTYQVLARKWRPQQFSEMIGQEHVLRALVNALDTNRLHHAYLFTGMRGVGKTTIARVFAKSLNCETNGISANPCGTCSTCKDIEAGSYIDLIEVDAASKTGVDDTRELLENVPYAPASGRFKVYLIDEVHMFSKSAFNALLKTLEEPPEHVKFLLATTDPEKVLVTILSRCLQFNLKSVPQSVLCDYLGKLLDKESIEWEPAALSHIAEASEGSVRDSLSLVEQAAAFGQGKVNAADVEAMLGRLSPSRVVELLQSIAESDAKTVLNQVNALAEYGPDYQQLLGSLLSTLHQLAMIQSVPDSIDESLVNGEKLTELAQIISPEDVQLFYQIGVSGRRDMPYVPDQKAALEMVLLRMLAFQPVTSIPVNPVMPPVINDNAKRDTPGSTGQTSSAQAVDPTARGGTVAPVPQPSSESGVVTKDTDTPGEAEEKPEEASPGKDRVASSASARQAMLDAALGVTPDSGGATPLSAQTAPPVQVGDAPSSAALQAASADSAPESRQVQALAEPATTSVGQAGDAGNEVSSSVEPEPGNSAQEPLRGDLHGDEPAIDDSTQPEAAVDDGTVWHAGNWVEITGRLKIDGMAAQLMSHSAFVALSGNTLKLQIEREHEHLNTEAFVTRLSDAVSTYRQQKTRVDIDLSDEQLLSPARIQAKNEQLALEAARLSIQQDPLVKELLDKVDGVVDETSVRPT